MNIGVHVSLSILVSSVCMPSSGIAGSYGSSSLHSHGAAGTSKLLLVHSEHCLAVNYTMFGRIPWPTVFKSRGLC